MLESSSKTIQYIVYFIVFSISQAFSIIGQYVTVPYKNLSYWGSMKMALPNAWINWFFVTFAINIGHANKLVTPTQNIFLLIIMQFIFLLIMNHYYLKQDIYTSDIVAFFILLLGYVISFDETVSKLLGYNKKTHSKNTKKSSLKKKKNRNNNRPKRVRFTQPV